MTKSEGSDETVQLEIGFGYALFDKAYLLCFDIIIDDKASIKLLSFVFIQARNIERAGAIGGIVIGECKNLSH